MSWDHRHLLCQALDSPEPSAAALERHELRVARALLAPRPRSRRRWAVATLVLAGGLVAGLVLGSGPRTFVLERADGESVMAGVTAWTDGRVEGTVEGRALALTLDQGRLELDVDPARDLDVQVSTDDAQVSVRGTHFSVTRGPSGTLVEVGRGRVAVTCSGRGQQQLLGAGGRVTCLRSVVLGLGLEVGQRSVWALERALQTTRAALELPGGTASTRAAAAALGRTGCTDAEPFLAALHAAGDAQALDRETDPAAAARPRAQGDGLVR